MFDAIKELFSPKTVVGLQVENGYMRAVQVSAAFTSPTVDRAAVQEIRDPEAISEELARFLDREGMTPELVITCLPTTAAAVREINIPFESPKKLGRIIKYQLEPYVPYPVERMVVDYVPGEPGRPILVVGLEKEKLCGHIDELRKAGVEPGIVSLDAMALYGLYLRVEGFGDLRAVSIVHRDKDRILILVVNQGRLELHRVLQGPQNHLNQIKETFDIYGLKNPEKPISIVLLTGCGGSDEGFAEGLTKLSRLEVKPWRPFDRIKHGLGEIGTEVQSSLAVPLGLAVGFVETPLNNFNLRREEFALRTSGKLKGSLSYAAVSLLLLAGLVTFATFQSLHLSKRDYGLLKSEVVAIFKATCPNASTIVKGMEVEQMRQKIAENTREYQWLNAITGRAPVLDVLLVLSRNLAGFKDVKLDNLSLDGMRVDLDGRAPSFQTVDNLKSVLDRTGTFTLVKLVGAKMDGKDKMIRFSFVMERKA
jgi:Tfp pilus assembly PilM family ATPase/Tfp pilus assembly protein PilN